MVATAVHLDATSTILCGEKLLPRMDKLPSNYITAKTGLPAQICPLRPGPDLRPKPLLGLLLMGCLGKYWDRLLTEQVSSPNIIHSSCVYSEK